MDNRVSSDVTDCKAFYVMYPFNDTTKLYYAANENTRSDGFYFSTDDPEAIKATMKQI